jgi:molecular chaperone GrpE
MEENQQSAVADGLELESAQTETDAPRSEATDAAAELAQQNAELQDRLLRLQAEFDNFRKRTERERMEFAEYAGEQTVRALLPILDDFERALKAAAAAPGGEVDEFVRGVELIYSHFLDVLKKQGLEPIITEGAQFDPHQHQAIGRVDSAEHEDNTIVQEFQRGYNFKGRLLRPSMVQVAVKS